MCTTLRSVTRVPEAADQIHELLRHQDQRGEGNEMRSDAPAHGPAAHGQPGGQRPRYFDGGPPGGF